MFLMERLFWREEKNEVERIKRKNLMKGGEEMDRKDK